jgi:hypothetical protein
VWRLAWAGGGFSRRRATRILNALHTERFLIADGLGSEIPLPGERGVSCFFYAEHASKINLELFSFCKVLDLTANIAFVVSQLPNAPATWVFQTQLLLCQSLQSKELSNEKDHYLNNIDYGFLFKRLRKETFRCSEAR